MKEQKKKIFIIVVVLVALAAAFLIYWKATEHDRYIKGCIKDARTEISYCRNGLKDPYFDFEVPSSAKEEPTYIDFLSTQVSEMFDNAEYNILRNFLGHLESEAVRIPEIKEHITNLFNGVEDLDEVLEIRDKFDFLGYYDTDFALSRDTSSIAYYIESNGIEKISTTPGTGFYANEEDSHTFERIGLSMSPLYDATDTTYRGDFKIKQEYGVKLNSNYKETSYSDKYYYFRDTTIDFSPDDGECIYSGDYLFCFSPSGKLIDVKKIKKK